MYSLIIAISFSSINNEDIYSIHRENIINSNCNFDTIRIKKQDVLCNDYGIYKKYCEHYAIPEEFTIKRELGMEGKTNYNIKQSKIYIESYDNKIVLADFYYTFKCEHLDNNYQLYLRIIPRSDKSFREELLELLICIVLFIPVLILLVVIYPCIIIVSNFSSGFMLGSISSNSYNKKIYCD